MAKKQNTRAIRSPVNWRANIDSISAIVKDFSPSGLYIETPDDSKIGSIVKIYIDIPNTTKMSMVVEGVVTRMENNNGSVGIGIRFTEEPKIFTQ